MISYKMPFMQASQMEVRQLALLQEPALAERCLLFHIALPLKMLGISSWSNTVPMQVHYASSDPMRIEQLVDELVTDVRAS
jgi:hypothetical protein